MKSKIEFFDTAVKKHFTSRQAYNAEMAVYQLGLPMVPKLIDAKPGEWILMHKEDGVPYLDSFGIIDLKLLGKTIAGFHNATKQGDKCLCHIDNQPANILYGNGSFFLVDFSDSRWDFPELDISHLLLFWAADLPEKLFADSCKRFLEGYASIATFSSQRWQRCLEQSIAGFDARRAKFNKPGGKNPHAIQAANRNYLTTFADICSTGFSR